MHPLWKVRFFFASVLIRLDLGFRHRGVSLPVLRGAEGVFHHHARRSPGKTPRPAAAFPAQLGAVVPQLVQAAAGAAAQRAARSQVLRVLQVHLQNRLLPLHLLRPREFRADFWNS